MPHAVGVFILTLNQRGGGFAFCHRVGDTRAVGEREDGDAQFHFLGVFEQRPEFREAARICAALAALRAPTPAIRADAVKREVVGSESAWRKGGRCLLRQRMRCAA